MAQTTASVLSDLKTGKYAPLYFLYGEEEFQIDKISDYIEENALAPAEKSFNLTVVYGKDISLRAVLESSRKFPMMAKRQVIIIKEAQELQGLNKKEEQAILAKYAEKPVPSTILVFAHKHKKLDARTALFKSLKKHSILLESKKMYDNQIPDWIKNYCADNGYQINPKATQMLAEYIGNDLGRITKEIDKILLNFKEKEKKIEITQEIIAKFVGISKEFNVFELQNAFGQKNAYKVNQIINYFASNPRKNPIIPVVSLLFSYFSKILLVHHNQGKDNRSLAAILKVNPFFMKDYLQAARMYPLRKNLAIIGYIQKADLQSKGVDSVRNDYEILKELAFKILH